MNLDYIKSLCIDEEEVKWVVWAYNNHKKNSECGKKFDVCFISRNGNPYIQYFDSNGIALGNPFPAVSAVDDNGLIYYEAA